MEWCGRILHTNEQKQGCYFLCPLWGGKSFSCDNLILYSNCFSKCLFFSFLMSLSRDFSMSPFNLFLLLFAQCKTVKQTNESFSSKKQSRIKTMLFNSFRTLHKASRSLTESTLLQKILSFLFIQLKSYST